MQLSPPHVRRLPSRLLLVGALALLIGCNQPAPDDQPIAPRTGLIGDVRFAQDAPTSPSDAAQADLQAMIDARTEVENALGDAATWQEADRQARRLIAAPGPAPQQHYAEQFAAVAMLRSYLAAPATPAEREAVAYYAGLLVEHDSPEAALILTALEQAGDALNAERRAHLATRAAEAAQAHLDRSAACEGCDAMPSEVLERESRFEAEVAVAARELDLLARR